MESAGIAHRSTPPAVGAPAPTAPERALRPRGEHAGRSSAHSQAEPGERGRLGPARDYFALTKPRIISLLLWTTVMTMIVAKPSGLALSTVLWTCLGGYLSAGGAGAINHFIDRKIDARMSRTAKRPIVEGRIEPV